MLLGKCGSGYVEQSCCLCTLQAPFKAEAPLLLELFTLIFDGINVVDLLSADPPQPVNSASRQPRAVRSNAPSPGGAYDRHQGRLQSTAHLLSTITHIRVTT